MPSLSLHFFLLFASTGNRAVFVSIFFLCFYATAATPSYLHAVHSNSSSIRERNNEETHTHTFEKNRWGGRWFNHQCRHRFMRVLRKSETNGALKGEGRRKESSMKCPQKQNRKSKQRKLALSSGRHASTQADTQQIRTRSHAEGMSVRFLFLLHDISHAVALFFAPSPLLKRHSRHCIVKTGLILLSRDDGVWCGTNLYSFFVTAAYFFFVFYVCEFQSPGRRKRQTMAKQTMVALLPCHPVFHFGSLSFRP